MSVDHPQIVVVRRRSALEHEHHGGAWKIAFADFMTAMMAFFLVLWIISATDKNTKTVIARYFNPVKVEEPAKAQKGIHGAPSPDTDALGRDSGSPSAEKSRSDQSEPLSATVLETPEAAPKGTRQKQGAGLESKTPPDPARPNPTMSEEELFGDPRASLDKIAGEIGPGLDEAIRDPFRPLGSDKTNSVAATAPGAPPPGDAAEPKLSAELPNPTPGGLGSQSIQKRDSFRQEPQGQEGVKHEGLTPSQAASPQTKTEQPPAVDAKPAAEASRSREAADLLAEVKKRLGAEAQSIPGPKLDVQATEEGILISLTDRQSFSMFALGSAEPQPRVMRMMDAIAASLKTLAGSIVVRGHTDAHPYRSAIYDNWRLSSARAQMAYYMLNRAGIPEKRFERIEGFADHRLKDSARPFAAENRRIEILLREAKP